MDFLRTSGLVLTAAFWVVLSLPIAVLFVECFVAWFQRRKVSAIETGANVSSDVSVAILIPAHNESAMIGQTLQKLFEQVKNSERVVVVADNCSDSTAQIARDAGAEVLERHDELRRGKGYALEAGVEYLRACPPDVVIIVDADTLVTPSTIQVLANQVSRTGRPAQAIYLLNPPSQPGVKDWISTFAFRVRNLVRPVGQSALGIPCQLMGTGMAMPWDALAKIELGSSNLVEDMQLGVDFAMLGRPPQYCLSGKVLSDFPDSDKAKLTQRKRWEHGHMATILNQVPKLIWTAARKGRFDVFCMALDLSVPPLALLVMLWAGGAGVSLGIAWGWQVMWPIAWAGVTGTLLGLAIVLAWLGFGRDVPARVLLSIPLYVLWKLPMYLAFARSRGKSSWERTERPNQSTQITASNTGA